MLLSDLRRLAQQLQIELDLLDDARPSHLHDDLATVLQEGCMDLGDRRARQGLLVDRGEVLEPDVLLDHLPQRRERKRLNVVDELAELVDVDVWKQVRARREELAQLDEGRTKLLERLAERDRALAGCGLPADDTYLAQDAQEVGAPRDLRHLERALDLALVGHPRPVCPRSLRWKRRAGR